MLYVKNLLCTHFLWCGRCSGRSRWRYNSSLLQITACHRAGDDLSLYQNASSELILGMGLANERRRHHVTSSLIGWAYTQNDPWLWPWIIFASTSIREFNVNYWWPVCWSKYNEPWFSNKSLLSSISYLGHMISALLFHHRLRFDSVSIMLYSTLQEWWTRVVLCFVLSQFGTGRFIHIYYNDVIMGVIASQITSLASVYSTVCSDQRKHQSSASLALVRGIHRRPVNSPHGPSNAENVSIWWRHHGSVLLQWHKTIITRLFNTNKVTPNMGKWMALKLTEAEWRSYASVTSAIIDSDNGLSPVRRQAII